MNPLLAMWSQVRGDAATSDIFLRSIRYPITAQGAFIGNVLGGVRLSNDSAAQFVTGARHFPACATHVHVCTVQTRTPYSCRTCYGTHTATTTQSRRFGNTRSCAR
jgi:hypothetical protein